LLLDFSPLVLRRRIGLPQAGSALPGCKNDRHHRRHLQNRQDFATGRADIERSADVVSRAVWVEVGTGGVQAQAHQLNELARQNSTRPWIGGHLYASVRPFGIPFAQLIYR